MTQIGRSSRRTDIAVPTGGRVGLSWAALSDRGSRRSANEDSVLARAPIFSVADGMGGHAAGDVASSAVVKRLAECMESSFIAPESIVLALRRAVSDMAQVTLSDQVREVGMGTTVTGVALTTHEGSPYWLVFNVGDSRVYQLRDQELYQLTVDHSLVQQMLEAGEITADQMDTHPQANIITRAVGFGDDPSPDFGLVPVDIGARLLICSDGLTKELTPYGIRYFLESGDSASDAAKQLMDSALGNGGRDNVSLIVVDVLETPTSGRRARLARKSSEP